MTLIELREMCAKVADDFNKFMLSKGHAPSIASEVIAEGIRAIQLPEQEPIGILMESHDGIVSITVTSDKWDQQNLLRLWNLKKTTRTAKLIYEAPPSLNSSNPTVNDSLTVAALEKQVEELKTRLNQNVSLLVNETLQYENEILFKQVAELKESLRWVTDFVSPDGSYEHKEFQLAMERAK